MAKEPDSESPRARNMSLYSKVLVVIRPGPRVRLDFLNLVPGLKKFNNPCAIMLEENG